jgi:hypothetical protein
MTNVSESILQLINLESQNPQFAGRLRFLQIVQSNNLTDISLLINQTGFPKFEIEYWIELYRLSGIELLLYP